MLFTDEELTMRSMLAQVVIVLLRAGADDTIPGTTPDGAFISPREMGDKSRLHQQCLDCKHNTKPSIFLKNVYCGGFMESEWHHIVSYSELKRCALGTSYGRSVDSTSSR